MDLRLPGVGATAVVTTDGPRYEIEELGQWIVELGGKSPFAGNRDEASFYRAILRGFEAWIIVDRAGNAIPIERTDSTGKVVDYFSSRTDAWRRIDELRVLASQAHGPGPSTGASQKTPALTTYVTAGFDEAGSDDEAGITKAGSDVSGSDVSDSDDAGSDEAGIYTDQKEPCHDASNPMLAVALDYINRGWSPIPVKYRAKNPDAGDDWQKLRITAATAPRYFNGKPQNIGILQGQPSGGLTDVDLDCLEAIAAAPFLLPETAVFGHASKPNSHWIYKTNLFETEILPAHGLADMRHRGR